MDTFTIAAILSAARHKSLSRAAAELSYTPSAMSHMLTAFEQELGVTIFHRRSTGVELTEEGKALYPKLSAMLKSEAELRRTAADLQHKRENSLRIATYSSISRNLLTDLLKRFKEVYPEVQLEVTVADKLTGWLEGDRADIIFADRPACGENEWFPIMEDEYLAVLPAPFTDAETISRETLYEHPFLYTDDKPLHGYFDRSRFRDLIYFRSEDDLSIIRMVRAGMGITVLPELVLRENAQDLRLLPLDPPLYRALGFACRPERQRTPALSRFIAFLQET